MIAVGRGTVLQRAGLLAGALALGGALSAGAQAIMPSDTAALMRTVRVLAADSMEGRLAGAPGGARARRYLLQQLRGLGVLPAGGELEHPFPLPGDQGTGVNLLAVIPGTRDPGRYIVLSAHYDHLGIRYGQIYNGADDNASGTAAVLAIAKALRRQPLQHSVVVALFDAEEEGELGARAFMAAPPVPKEAILLNVNLDMVSHSEKGELYAAGTRFSPLLRPLLDSVARGAPVHLRFGHDRPGIPGEADWTGQSDQVAFHLAGIPFICFGVEDHQDYHEPTDDPETLTPAFFGGAVGTILEALRRLDRLPTRYSRLSRTRSTP